MICWKCNRPVKESSNIAPGETFVQCVICREVWLGDYPSHREKLNGDWARRLLDEKAKRLMEQAQHDMLHGDSDDPRWARF